MSNVTAEPGELKMTIQITHKDTGKVEEYILTSIDPVEIPQPEGEVKCLQQ